MERKSRFSVRGTGLSKKSDILFQVKYNESKKQLIVYVDEECLFARRIIGKPMEIRCSPRYCKHRYQGSAIATGFLSGKAVGVRDAKPGNLLFVVFTYFSEGKRSQDIENELFSGLDGFYPQGLFRWR